MGEGTAGDAGDFRVVHLNDANRNTEAGFCNNFIVTSKYTVASFLPKFLFESFRKLSNLYFLIICILQCIPEISNTSGQPSTLPPLLFIITVDGVFAVLEDHKRHQADNVANASPTLVLDRETRKFKEVSWADVVVGDIVKVVNRGLVPADMLVLAVSEVSAQNPCGICYVATKSLDGETNMKVRSAMECTLASMGSVDNLVAMKGVIRCEHPNNAINSFQGVLELEGKDKASIPYESIILRGCIIRNTDWVHGLVFNTGKDTKIMMSNSAPPSKMSSMDRSINQYTVVLLAILIIFSAVGATGAVTWKSNHSSVWYLELGVSDNSAFVDWLIMLFYYLLLMYQFVPISLAVSMSMVKYIQAQFIQWDITIYHPDTDTPTLVRSMSLNEELGQISYIFSDKTGTLTCNVMEFRKCSIGGVSYGNGTTEIGLAALRRAGKSLPDITVQSKGPKVPYVNFDGPELFTDMKGNSGSVQQGRIDAFFTHLAVCHTVIPERHEGSNEVTLSASSPDEQALVAGAGYFGYEFVNRSPGVAHVNVHGTVQKYEMLDVLEFNSTRKRMSTIIRHPNGRIFLYSKGADVIIYGLLKKDGEDESTSSHLQEITRRHIDQYAEDGLRTLTIAVREIEPSYYAKWASRFHEAQNNLAEIDKRKKDLPNAVDECMNEIESDLELLGATAIEDKLQAGVPDTIANLACAGIKIWVLTGDKEETAINIGFACQLVTNDMKLFIINGKNAPTPEILESTLRDEIGERCADVTVYLASPPSTRGELRELALVIDGETLMFALRGSCRSLLAEFSQYCKAVIACRVSPAQKAEMVALIKEYVPGVRTLAIGDGANDVSMIQEAHVGVGISGQEGMQAVNSSDYAIAQFRFLQRLLLVHGRWNYRRMAQLVLYIFYKNILFTAAQYWFTLLCGFSGQKFYLESGTQLYNIALTAIPIVAASILDQDVNDEVAMTFPKLYFTGPRDEDINPKSFSLWVVGAIVESLIITFVTLHGMENAGFHGASPTMWLEGYVVFTLVVSIANAKLFIFQNSFYFFNYFLYAGSVGGWLLVALVCSHVTILSDLTWEQMLEQAFGQASFWLIWLFVPVAALSYAHLLNGIRSTFFPEYWHLAKEVIKFNLDRKFLQWNDNSNASVAVPARLPHSKAPRKSGSVIPTNGRPSQHRTTLQKAYHGFAFSKDGYAGATETRLLMSRGSVTRGEV
ncbi:Phospholipid-transporting ATPase [Phytophthora fragariae]|uniref:Phospholipid-transporting ATPase n=1 Tax=Phytophthora fragariae TaxID=53985 RepID=A0A6A3LFV9_9STRA|nr:Phospholipid-transporting ATPase [Phytophthora fragariae]